MITHIYIFLSATDTYANLSLTRQFSDFESFIITIFPFAWLFFVTRNCMIINVEKWYCLIYNLRAKRPILVSFIAFDAEEINWYTFIKHHLCLHRWKRQAVSLVIKINACFCTVILERSIYIVKNNLKRTVEKSKHQPPSRGSHVFFMNLDSN